MEGRRAGVESRKRQNSFSFRFSLRILREDGILSRVHVVTRCVPLTGCHPRNPALLIKSERKNQSGLALDTDEHLMEGPLRRAEAARP